VLNNGQDGWFYVDPNSATNWVMDVTEPGLLAGANITLTRTATSLTIATTGGGGLPCTTTALSLQYNNAGAFGCLSNFTWASATGILTANQLANSNDTILGNRFTDTAPTGNYWRYRNAAGTVDSGALDVNGNLKALTSVQTTNAAPGCTAGTAGAWCAAEGTAFTNVAGTAGIYPDSTQHEFMAKTNGAATVGMMVRSQPSPISVTGATAAVANGTSLCAAAAGACNVAGQYRVTAYFDSTVVCATPGPAAIGFNVTFTDEIGTKTAQSIPLDVNGATTLTGTMALGDAVTNATGTASFWSTGANAIGYGVTYTACTSGTGTFARRITVERLQ